VPKDTKYVNMGLDIGTELMVLELNFISNAHNWGVTVVDPNGNITSVLDSYNEEQLNIVVPIYEDIDYIVTKIHLIIFNNRDKGMYEVYLCN
jgi:hypothetical protein